MKLLASLLLALPATVALTGCPNMSAQNREELASEQARTPELRPYTVDIQAMADAYKTIADTPEGKVRPRMIATVLQVLPADDSDTQAVIRENHLPEVSGAGVALVYTPHGWSMMLVPPGLKVEEKNVVEFTLPSAIEFDDLNDTQGMQTRLEELQSDGSVGIQSVRSDCEGNTSGSGPFSMSCGGKPASFVFNAEQFSTGTLKWLNSSGPAGNTSGLRWLPRRA